MKLSDLFIGPVLFASQLTIKSGFNNPDEAKVLTGILINVWTRHFNRDMREYFDDREKVFDLWEGFVDANRQKIKYILETATQEFLGLETNTEATGDNIGYNTDFLGGDGKTDKDVSSNSAKSVVVDRKDKTKIFRAADRNTLFNNFINQICETFTFEELTW